MTIRNKIILAGFCAVCTLPATAFSAAPILDPNLKVDEPLPKTEKELVRDTEDHEGIFTFSFENDLFNNEDDNYTNGIRFAFISAENNIPGWLENSANAIPFFADEGHKRWTFAAGQSIYTPSDISQTGLQVDDRPYAGFLYGTVGVLSDTGKRVDNLQLTLGVVGPASKGEEAQKLIHDQINGDEPRGWNGQIRDEVGVNLAYTRQIRNFYRSSPQGYAFDITPSFGGSVGNIFTHASVGSVVRFGYDLPADYGPPLLQPSLAGSDFFIPTKEFGWYLFAGVEGRAVARDIFLDGNTFRSSHHVEKENLVGDLQGGIAITFNDMRLAYTQIMRTEEFKTQTEGDSYGALTLSMRF